MAVMNGLAYGRVCAGVLPSKMMPRILSRGIRRAAVFAGKGHFLTATLFERRLREHPIRRRYSRATSPSSTHSLNSWQPSMTFNRSC